jgi:hypothetical protein
MPSSEPFMTDRADPTDPSAKHDDADFTIDLMPAAQDHAAPQVEPQREHLEQRAIKEGIARVEAEAKAAVAAENRAHAEARARSLAEERAAMDAEAAAAALANAQAS